MAAEESTAKQRTSDLPIDAGSSRNPNEAASLAIAMQLDDLVASLDFTFGEASDTLSVPPLVLALASVLQYLEGLSDHDLVSAVRLSPLLRCAVGLAPGAHCPDIHDLRAFRERLPENVLALRSFEELIARGCRLDPHRNSTADVPSAEAVFESVRGINRLELAQRTMQGALTSLLRAGLTKLDRLPAAWRDRYLGEGGDPARMHDPAAREKLALSVGADGYSLLDALHCRGKSAVAQWPQEVMRLEQVWLWLFEREGEDVEWRPARHGDVSGELNGAVRI